MSAFSLAVAAKTEAKLPGQSENQDAIYTAIETNKHDVQCGLFIVADGVGGHHDGSYASKLTISTLREQLEAIWDHVPDEPNQASQYLQSRLQQAIIEANSQITGYAKEKQVRMASTLTCVLVYGSLAIVANSGDSRTYLYRSQQLEQITIDHSVVDWLVRQGQLSPEAALTHPYRNVIMHALGAAETPEVDFFLRWLQPGDKLLLCSDGVWETVSHDQICDSLQTAVSPDTAVATLALAAQDHTDDVSLVLVEWSTA